MKIIIKFILKNIYEKKLRTFLIVLSIAISAALFFASSAVSDTAIQMYVEKMSQFYGNAEIVVEPGSKSLSPFFSTQEAKVFQGQIDYMIGNISTSGYFKYSESESVNISIRGTTLEDMQRNNPVNLYAQSNLYPFEGKKIIIGKQASEKYHLKLGDTFDFDLDNSRQHFTIAAIAMSEKLFSDEQNSMFAIIPLDTAGSLLNARGKINTAFIKLKNPADIQPMIKSLSDVYSRYNVRKPFSDQESERQISSIAIPFMLMSVIASLMSIFIIYSSFKVITIERMPVIGTFRSIGATRKMTNIVLIAESLLYGIIGGIAGSVLGIGFLYGITYMITPPFLRDVGLSVRFTPVHFIGAFLAAVLLCFISSVIPIIKVSKIPVKDIVLNSLERRKSGKKPWKPVLGVVLLGIGLTLPRFVPKNLALFVDMTSMIACIAAMVLLVPMVTKLMAGLLETLYNRFFGNIAILSLKNLKENKSLINCITLLAIGISTLLMINTISNSVSKEVLNAYSTFNFQIMTWVPDLDRNTENKIRSIPGVDGTYGILSASNIEVVGSNDKIMCIDGIDKNKHADFMTMDMETNIKDTFEELYSGRNILLTSILRDKFNFKKGDKILLKFPKGEREYTITGFFNSLNYNGSYAMIADSYLKLDTGIKFYSYIDVKAGKNPDEAAREIKNRFARESPWVDTVKNMEKDNMESNARMFGVLQGFSILALLIGIIGIFNNLIISFIERKHSLAMFRSVGMSKQQIIQMILMESTGGGLLGGIIGVVFGFILLSIVPYLIRAIEQPLPIHSNYSSSFVYLLAGTIITLIASISPALKSSKLNLIEAIKYE